MSGAYTEQGLPFAAGSHESYQAAVRAAQTRGVKTRAYLRFLARYGARTDHESRTYFGWPLSSLCSIRNNVMTAGLVERSAESKVGPHGLKCRRWQLTEAGRKAVDAMMREARAGEAQ